jgi:hypothetical protein
MDFERAHANFGVPVITAVHAAREKIIERVGIQMPAMGRIAERIDVGVVWRQKENGPAGLCNAMKLFHGGNDIAHVLDQMLATNLVEGTITERKVPVIEMTDHVGAGRRIHVDTDRPGILIGTTSNVENARQIALRREILARNFNFYRLICGSALLRFRATLLGAKRAEVHGIAGVKRGKQKVARRLIVIFRRERRAKARVVNQIGADEKCIGAENIATHE